GVIDQDRHVPHADDGRITYGQGSTRLRDGVARPAGEVVEQRETPGDVPVLLEMFGVEPDGGVSERLKCHRAVDTTTLGEAVIDPAVTLVPDRIDPRGELLVPEDLVPVKRRPVRVAGADTRADGAQVAIEVRPLGRRVHDAARRSGAEEDRIGSTREVES